MDKKIAIALHGGASEDSKFIRNHLPGFEKGLRTAISEAYQLLERGGSALDAVEEAVKAMEDNPLFNAGRGAAFNQKAEIEMDASIMDGSERKSGSVALVKNVKNPVALARKVMEKTKSVFLAGNGAIEFAKNSKLNMEPDAYFSTVHQFEEYQKVRDKTAKGLLQKLKMHGTVGAVALDRNGHLASAVSTGGTVFQHEGRVSDSAIIGAGCYADDSTCAVSATGDGEFIIRCALAFSISELMRTTGYDMQQACIHAIRAACADNEADLGVISIDRRGNFGICFNCDQMHRAWMSSTQPLQIATYKEL
jgi:beta-aspartyl-peptidase (threonine type)